MMSITIEVTESQPVFSETEQKIAELHREATHYKGSDWDKSIACLQEAAQLMRQHHTSHLMEQWLRLPLFLQQAGRFDEAMQEFEQLLSEAPAKAEKELAAYFGDAHIKCRIHLDYSRIYDKMRLACQRQKRVDDAKKYQELYEQHKVSHAEWCLIIDQENKAQYEAHFGERAYKA
jgi:tetratricopeptide (TPR) repeat protein